MMKGLWVGFGEEGWGWGFGSDGKNWQRRYWEHWIRDDVDFSN